MNLTGQPAYQKHTAEDYRLDRKYQEWCRKQPSAVSGGKPCVYAHYRNANNAGTGYKPLFSGLPLTRAEHDLQHQIGQFSFMDREEWERKVEEHLERWKNEQRISS